MIIGVPKEICPGEQRVALTPANVSALLKKQGVEIIIERGAGDIAGYPDSAFEAAGAKLVDRDEIFASAQVVLQVQTPGSNTRNGSEDLDKLKQGQIVIGMTDPLANPQFAQTLADKKVTGLALELVPRITRAQAMDVLSSMAMIAGYKCVLLAANESQRMFPMNMTAAGTLNASRVFVMGAGVAGLQACATAKRLGAVVEAYDVRPAAREQILSVGAKPVELDQQSVGRLSRMDAMQGQAMALATRQRQEQRMRQLIAALRRIDEDDYGYCEDCGKPINPRRLEIDPATLFCLDCASARE